MLSQIRRVKSPPSRLWMRFFVGSLQAPRRWMFKAVVRYSGEPDYANQKQLNLKLQLDCGRIDFATPANDSARTSMQARNLQHLITPFVPPIAEGFPTVVHALLSFLTTAYKMVHTDSEWQIAQKVAEDALKNTDYACQGLERLPGGFINFAFRNRLARPIEGIGQTVVVKMTEDKSKIEKTTGEEFTLHKTRSYYEHHVLTHHIPSFCSNDESDESPSILVRVPKVLDYFPNNYVQIIEDLPDTMTLKAHLLKKPFDPAFAAACGRAIGGWAVKFHTWGRHPDQEQLRKVLGDYREAGIFKYRLSCGRLDATIEKFPELLDNKRLLFKNVSERVLALTHENGIGVVHGDFWPGNLVFVSSAKNVDGDTTSGDYDAHLDNKQLIFMLDWELSHLSSIVIDLGTMFAELYILYFFENSSSALVILDSFLEAYGSIETQDALNTMIYCGVHLIIWPCRTEWSENSKLKDCIQFGCDILNNAYNGDTAWFKEGQFQQLF